MSKSPVIRLPYASIFNDMMYGFDNQLETFFGPNGAPNGKSSVKVVPLSNDTELSEAAKKTNTDKIGFPFFARRFNSIEERNDEMNSFLMRLNGISRQDNAGEWFQFRLMPLKLTVTINYICLDEKDLFIFSQRWMDCSRLHYLDFDLNYNDNDIKIKVNCDATITIPEFSGTDNDTGSMFNCEVSVTIDGYSGSITPLATLNQINVGSYAGSRPAGKFHDNKTRVHQPLAAYRKAKFVIKDGQMYNNDKVIIERGGK